MNLIDFIKRQPIPEPWEAGGKIPWHDPDFSQRMLRAHLSQEHNAASRRFAVIDQHVNWIHHQCLAGRPGKILDLGCGPGLYTSRLARLGHTCTGIDFSPASIAYAREAANRDGLSCRYTLTDLRASDFGDNYDLVMLIFGEFNVFRVQHIQAIMEKAHAALNPDGILLLEPHTFEAVHQRGLSRPGWSSVEPGQGLFSDQAYIHLTESFWLEQEQAAITRHYIIDADQGDVAAHSETMLAYTETDYRQLLEACGFKDITFHPGLTGNPETADPHLCAITAYP